MRSSVAISMRRARSCLRCASEYRTAGGLPALNRAGLSLDFATI
jgi:hypothetical protein